MMKVLLVALLVALAGCKTAPRIEVRTVKVAVPVACQETEPDRPIMPTEALSPGVSLDDFAKSAMAEIERREGYEILLRGALSNCMKPIE